MPTCPLCAGTRPTEAARHRRGLLWRCPGCDLLFLDPSTHPSPRSAAERYLRHRNSIDDPGYVRILRELLDPLLHRIKPGARCLDYGSGPTPVLQELALRAGLECDAYDPHFAPDPPRPPYDVVFLCEVAEHFARPGDEFARLWGCLVPGGWLGVRTELWSQATDLAGWHYLSDPTHVVFYREESFRWLAARGRWDLEWSDGRRIVLLRRPPEATVPGR